MNLSAEHILALNKHPLHYGLLQSATVTHYEENPTCGDIVTLSLQIENDHVTALGWEGEGCAISRAAMSLLADELTGTSIKDITKITPEQVYELLGVPIGSRRVKCALLGLHTLKNALLILQEKEKQTWLETINPAV